MIIVLLSVIYYNTGNHSFQKNTKPITVKRRLQDQEACTSACTKKISLRFEVRQDASPPFQWAIDMIPPTIRKYLITSMKRTLSEGQSANTKKPRMGSNESKQSKKESNDNIMSEEKMDIVATVEGKNRPSNERKKKKAKDGSR